MIERAELRSRPSPGHLALAAVAVLTLGGLLLRIPAFGDSLFGDELSSYFVVTGRSLGGTLHLLNGHAIELNPPLYFVLAWLTERVAGSSAESLRFVSLLAGTVAIPLTYALGRLTVGVRAGLLAATLAALSPFLLYFSAEARSYELLLFTTLLSTVTLLRALGTGGLRWWAAYAVCSCAAMYTHYTSVFLLAGQFLWAFATHSEARRWLIGANLAAAVAYLPWLPSLIATTHNVGRGVIGFLEPFSLHVIGLSLGRWSIGHPYLSVATIPGVAAAVAIVAGVLLSLAVLAGALPRRPFAPARRNATLPVVLLISSPLGLALYSSVSQTVWDTRSLISSWPGLAVCVAAALSGGWSVARGRREGSARLSAVAMALAAVLVLGGLAVGAFKTLERSHRRPDYAAVAGFVAARGAPGDPVVNFGSLTPGPPNEMEAALSLAPTRAARDHPVVRLGEPPLQAVLRAPAYAPLPARSGRAVAAEAVRMAVHGRLFLVMSGFAPLSTIEVQRRLRTPLPAHNRFNSLAEFLRALPPAYRPVAVRSRPGIYRVTVYEFRRP